jgi:hypothetical protein
MADRATGDTRTRSVQAANIQVTTPSGKAITKADYAVTWP